MLLTGHGIFGDTLLFFSFICMDGYPFFKYFSSIGFS